MAKDKGWKVEVVDADGCSSGGNSFWERARLVNGSHTRWNRAAMSSNGYNRVRAFEVKQRHLLAVKLCGGFLANGGEDILRWAGGSQKGCHVS